MLSFKGKAVHKFETFRIFKLIKGNLKGNKITWIHRQILIKEYDIKTSKTILVKL